MGSVLESDRGSRLLRFRRELVFQLFTQAGSFWEAVRDVRARWEFEPVRESVAFTIQTDRQNKYVSVNVGIYQHSSGVIGATTANHRPHGRYDGVAPGSRIVSIFFGVNIPHAMIEALIVAFTDPRIDVVLLEQNSTVGNDYQLADGRNPMSILINRMTDRYRKLMLAPGSNDAG